VVQRWARGWMIGGSSPGTGWECFSFSIASRPALGPTQPLTQWVRGAVSLRIKRPWRNADHSPPSSAKVKNAWSYTSTLPICLYGVVLSWSTGTNLHFTLCIRSTLWWYEGCAGEIIRLIDTRPVIGNLWHVK
jgi:hypothetical protein